MLKQQLEKFFISLVFEERGIFRGANIDETLYISPLVMDRVPEIGFLGTQNQTKNGIKAFSKWSARKAL